MAGSRGQWVGLQCHRSTPVAAVRALEVLVRRTARAELHVSFRLDGETSRILITPPGEARVGKELWRHTCFETFVAVEGRAGYHEFNFAPSGEWAVYQFRGYRDGDLLSDESMRPQIAVRADASRLELDVLVRLDRLSAIHSRAALRLGLSAVVETREGLSYWALHHPKEKPDFHDAGGFVLVLAPQAGERVLE